MECIEVSVEASHEAAESLSSLLTEIGFRDTVIEEKWDSTGPARMVSVKTYLSPDQASRIPEIEEAIWHLGQLGGISPPDVRELSEADWATRWKADYQVQHLGQRIVVKPSWLPYAPTSAGEVVVELEPGMAFGTGLHPSTRLCITAMEELIKPRSTVLDVGTGSGILAILAAKLGAAHVLALDIDPVALQVAIENAARNRVEDQVSFFQASLSPTSQLFQQGSDEPEVVPLFRDLNVDHDVFDLLVMNILAPVIADSTHEVSSLLAENATFILSGLLKTQESWIRESLSEAGLAVEATYESGDWICLCGARAAAPPREPVRFISTRLDG